MSPEVRLNRLNCVFLNSKPEKTSNSLLTLLPWPVLQSAVDRYTLWRRTTWEKWWGRCARENLSRGRCAFHVAEPVTGRQGSGHPPTKVFCTLSWRHVGQTLFGALPRFEGSGFTLRQRLTLRLAVGGVRETPRLNRRGASQSCDPLRVGRVWWIVHTLSEGRWSRFSAGGFGSRFAHRQQRVEIYTDILPTPLMNHRDGSSFLAVTSHGVRDSI